MFVSIHVLLLKVPQRKKKRQEMTLGVAAHRNEATVVNRIGAGFFNITAGVHECGSVAATTATWSAPSSSVDDPLDPLYSVNRFLNMYDKFQVY